MPYETVSGAYERASRTSHSTAVVRAAAERAEFYVPADAVPDVEKFQPKIVTRAARLGAESMIDAQLDAALAIDGSRVAEQVRDGLPSVVYGYAQAAAAFVDLAAIETQRAARFVDPVEIERAANTALVSMDLPLAGAYTRQGVNIRDSWREALDHLFRSKKVEVNRIHQTLLELLFLLHGRPGAPASTVPVNCIDEQCPTEDIGIGPGGGKCPTCGAELRPTDTLRIHEEVLEEGTNESALGRLMAVVELLVLVGLATLLWTQARDTLLQRTLFLVDGPLAMYGPPAKLRGRALDYFQAMGSSSRGQAPYICGLEKSGALVDYAKKLAGHEVLQPGDLLVCDSEIIATITNTQNPDAYGKETYWGRKFVYRALDGRVVVPTVVPTRGAPYDATGGQPLPEAYGTLNQVLDVIDRTGSSMYRDGVIPVAVAHGKAAFPIGVGTDVLRLVAKQKLGI